MALSRTDHITAIQAIVDLGLIYRDEGPDGLAQEITVRVTQLLRNFDPLADLPTSTQNDLTLIKNVSSLDVRGVLPDRTPSDIADEVARVRVETKISEDVDGANPFLDDDPTSESEQNDVLDRIAGLSENARLKGLIPGDTIHFHVEERGQTTIDVEWLYAPAVIPDIASRANIGDSPEGWLRFVANVDEVWRYFHG